MAKTYYTKCGNTFEKSSTAGVTRFEEINNKCKDCPYIEYGSTYRGGKEVPITYCQAGSKKPNHKNEYSTTCETDATTLSIISLDMDFLKTVYEFACSQPGYSGSTRWPNVFHGLDKDDCRKSMPLYFENNKKGKAVKKAIIDKFFKELNQEKLDNCSKCFECDGFLGERETSAYGKCTKRKTFVTRKQKACDKFVLFEKDISLFPVPESISKKVCPFYKSHKEDAAFIECRDTVNIHHAGWIKPRDNGELHNRYYHYTCCGTYYACALYQEQKGERKPTCNTCLNSNSVEGFRGEKVICLVTGAEIEGHNPDTVCEWHNKIYKPQKDISAASNEKKCVECEHCKKAENSFTHPVPFMCFKAEHRNGRDWYFNADSKSCSNFNKTKKDRISSNGCPYYGGIVFLGKAQNVRCDDKHFYPVSSDHEAKDMKNKCQTLYKYCRSYTVKELVKLGIDLGPLSSPTKDTEHLINLLEEVRSQESTCANCKFIGGYKDYDESDGSFRWKCINANAANSVASNASCCSNYERMEVLLMTKNLEKVGLLRTMDNLNNESEGTGEALDSYLQYIRKKAEDIACSYVEIGFTLINIRDNKFYKARGYNSLVDCVETELHMKKSTAYNLIKIAEKFGDPETKRLKAEYSQYNYVQCLEMSTMTNEELLLTSSDMSKRDMQVMKKSNRLEKPTEDNNPIVAPGNGITQLTEATGGSVIDITEYKIVGHDNEDKEIQEQTNPVHLEEGTAAHNKGETSHSFDCEERIEIQEEDSELDNYLNTSMIGLQDSGNISDDRLVKDLLIENDNYKMRIAALEKDKDIFRELVSQIDSKLEKLTKKQIRNALWDFLSTGDISFREE